MAQHMFQTVRERLIRTPSGTPSVPIDARCSVSRRLDPRLTVRRAPAILRATSRRAGYERDEYPSSVGRETRWLVETGAASTVNGPGSLRTERQARGDARTAQ